MKYRMIVIDLDDTLLGNDLVISSTNKKAIAAAVEKGVMVIVATGRMFKSAFPYVKELALSSPVISYQGALIKDIPSGSTILHRPVPMEFAAEIIKDARSEGVYLQVYIDDEYYMEKECSYSKKYEHLSGIEGIVVGSFDYFLKREPTKLLIIDEPERIRILKDKYQRTFKNNIQITISKPEYLEFTHKDATKGKAVEYLSKKFNIRREEIIAIGDSYNDISMIEYAGLGIAMGNAPEEVKAFADYVTYSNEEEGVAHVIEEFILKGGRRGGYHTD